MITDTEIKAAGFRALVAALGDVQAEKFIAAIPYAGECGTNWSGRKGQFQRIYAGRFGKGVSLEK